MENSPPPREEGPSDEDLVRQTQEGDPAAFDVLMQRHMPRVYGVVYNMTHNHADTNDLLMETFAKAFRSIQGFKSDSAFYTWIYRIAMNQTLNHLRRNKHRAQVSLDDDESDLNDLPEFMDASMGVDIEKQAELQELQKKLNESLMRLSDEHRAVVTLFDIEGLSHAEIAKTMGCSEGTVRSRLFYAHKQLQKMLKTYIKEA
jgi:RNA polymerase sigma factor (sigma-70 family)